LQSSTPASGKLIPVSAWMVVAILSSIATMVMYAETMLVPAIPDLINDFNIPYSTSSWILTTYLITGAVMTPIAGKLSDIYGKKKILLIIMIFYTVGVSIAGFSTNIDYMLIARGFQGVGISMFPIAFSIVRAQFPREKMAIGQGIITSMYGGGAVIGLSIGGTIIQHYSWHATFFTLIPIAIALLFIIWRFIHVDREGVEQTRKKEEERIHELQQQQQQQQQETEPTERRNNSESIKRKITTTMSKSSKSATSKPTMDIQGAITLAVAITSFLLVLTYLEMGSSDDNNSAASTSTIQIASFLVAGIISLALFILIEKRSASPLFDYSLMLNKRILLATLIIIIVGFSMFIVFQTIPILVENPKPVGFGGDPISAANVQLPFALVFLVFGPVSGLLISKLGSMKPIMVGTLLGVIGFFFTLISHSTELSLSINLAIISVGLALSNVGAQNIIILSIPRQNSGASLGMTTFLRIVGSSIAPALSGMFLQEYQYTVNIGGKQQSFPSPEAYNFIFLTATILSIVSVLLAVVLFRTGPPKCQNHLPEEKGNMGTKITENIKQEILSWPGVTSNPYHLGGGIEFRVNKRDMGHIHGDKLADLPFPIEIRKQLIASGKVLPHIIYPESTWVSYIIHSEEDVPKIVDLFRLQYERLKNKPPIISSSR
jgi:MFS family permease